MSEKTKLLKNTGLIAIGSFGAKAISFLLLPLYTSLLTTGEYGVFDFIVACSTFIQPVLSFAMYEAMFRFIIEKGNDSNELKKISSNAFFIIITGLLFGCVILFLINLLLGFEQWWDIWVYVFVSSLYAYASYLLRAIGKIKDYTIISAGKSIFQLILNVIAVAVLNMGVKGLIYSLVISEMVSFFIIFVKDKLWKQISMKYVSKNLSIEMLKYALPLVPNTLCAQIINLSDRLMISSILGPSENGIYSVSYKFPNLVETIYHYFYLAWSENASSVIKKGKEKARQYYQELYKIIDNMVFSVIIMMIAGMSILYRILIKGDYISGFAIVPMLMLSMYFNSISKFFSGIHVALKQTRNLAKSTVISAIVNVSINFIFLKKYGLYVAAFSTLVSTILMYVMRWFDINKSMKINISINHVIGHIIIIICIILLYSYDQIWKITLAIVISGLYAVYINIDILKTIYTKIIKKIANIF